MPSATTRSKRGLDVKRDASRRGASVADLHVDSRIVKEVAEDKLNACSSMSSEYDAGRRMEPSTWLLDLASAVQLPLALLLLFFEHRHLLVSLHPLYGGYLSERFGGPSTAACRTSLVLAATADLMIVCFNSRRDHFARDRHPQNAAKDITGAREATSASPSNSWPSLLLSTSGLALASVLASSIIRRLSLFIELLGLEPDHEVQLLIAVAGAGPAFVAMQLFVLGMRSIWERRYRSHHDTGAPRKSAGTIALRAIYDAILLITFQLAATSSTTHSTARWLEQWWTAVMGLERISAGTAITLLVAICSLASSLRASSPQAASKFSRPMLAQGIAATLLAIALAQTLWRSEQVPFTALDGNLRILNSTASTTGRIVVADNLVDGYRFLRCDHSLLGGRWMRQSASDGEGVELGDSIFSAFVLQEAVRLVERASDQAAGKQSALIIGLGAGISANALISHGIDVDIIELDPAVYHAARDDLGFGSPVQPRRVDLVDAAERVAEMARQERQKSQEREPDQDQQSQMAAPTLYDFAIHDCFTGGSVPHELFSDAFWRDLATIMKPDGVVAVNYAGLLHSAPALTLRKTLSATFGQCRTFRDALGAVASHGEQEQEGDQELANMVVICSMSPNPISPLSFRPPIPADYLGSPLRHAVLTSFTEHEMPDSAPARPADHQAPSRSKARESPAITTVDALDEKHQQLTSSRVTWHAMRKIMGRRWWVVY